MPDLRIIFMGTPEFAVPSLEALIDQKFDVVAVITAPDKPQGRGQNLIPSAVKQCALRYKLPVLQPTHLKSPLFLEELKKFEANLQVVVAFRMLPEVVWAMPAIGTFNLHASLLPQYRGAAPINWAIINGEQETGVTTFFLRHEIDTGSIIFQEKEPIFMADDAGALYDRLMKKGSELVLKTVRAIESNTYPSLPQAEPDVVKAAPKIFKETCEINWRQGGEQVRNFVRGLSPYPAAWTVVNGRTFKIFSVIQVPYDKTSEPGTFVTDGKNYLYFRTSNEWLSINELQPEGKRRMTTKEFFRGNEF